MSSIYDNEDVGEDPGPDRDDLGETKTCPECETVNNWRETECTECGASLEEDDREPDYDDEGGRDDDDFADPGGNSALRAATPSNPRNLPCPTCGAPNRLTPADRARGYQCDRCADRAERGGY